MNSVVLIGRLTRDPELRYTTSQMAVATFSLAIDRPVRIFHYLLEKSSYGHGFFLVGMLA